MTHIGLGCDKFTFAVYIANTPPMAEYTELTQVNSLHSGEIAAIGQACGNGWRKVFNVYAKLLFTLDHTEFNYQNMAPSWQLYRDKHLLQAGSETALLFSAPDLTSAQVKYHIICGRTYAKSLINTGQLTTKLTWLDDEFAIDRKNNVFVCPYFDYRQLSNVKIERLAKLLAS